MEKLFNHLQFWEDTKQRDPAALMACDEALLITGSGVPVMRFYRWSAPAVTFGYAQRIEAVRTSARGLPLMRRWSGGGLVFHGNDLTLGLAIPVTEAAAFGSSRDIYRSIHEGLLTAIQNITPAARLVLPEECRCGPVCFESPVAFDIISGSSKICGGALRRSKAGVLYQGSLHLPGAIALEIARSLAREVSEFQNAALIESAVDGLVASKYGSPDWLALR